MNISYFKSTPTGTRIVSDSINADFIWLDADRDEVSFDIAEWKERVYTHCGYYIDEFHLLDILNTQHPSFFDLTNDYEILLVRKLLTTQTTPNINESLELQTVPVVFILTDRALITVRNAGSSTFANIHQRITQQMDQTLINRLPNSPIDLCLRILNAMIDRYLELRAPLTERIESWQTELLQGNRKFRHWPQLLKENLNLQQLENLCEEQLDALQELRDNYLDQQNNTLESNNSRRDLMLVRINDLLEHVTRVQNHASRMESALKSAIDLHFSATANDTNETMRFLTIITVTFAPLTLLTGIYGMNFDYMPGLHNLYGFWWLLIGMVLTTLILLYSFHRRRLVGRGKRSVTQLLSNQSE